MKKNKLFLGLMVSLTTIFGIVGCGTDNISSISSTSSSISSSVESSETGFVDYASSFKYDETSNRV